MEFEEMKPAGAENAPPQLTQEQKQEAFEPLQFAASNIALPEGCYHVYTSDEDFVEINANSAYEAMQKLDISAPHKIERFSLNRISVLTQDIISDASVEKAGAEVADGSSEVNQEQNPDDVSAATDDTKSEVELPTEEDAETRGLDGDEVDALLDGSADSSE